MKFVPIRSVEFARHSQSTGIVPGRARSRSRARRGAEIVELGVCLPLLVAVTLGTIEACAMIVLKQTLAVAAFEGARLGVIKGSEAINVEAQCEYVLLDHSVANYSISMSPSDPASLQPGDFFRVTVTAQCAPNSLVGGIFYAGKSFSESVELAYR